MMQRRHPGPRRLEQREIKSTLPAPTSSPLPINTGVAPTASSSRPALAAVMTLFGSLLIIGAAIYLYRTRIRGEKRNSVPSSLFGKVSMYRASNTAKHIDFNDISVYTEKPQALVVTPVEAPSSVDGTQAGWVPQIRAYSVPEPTLPEPAAQPKKKSSTSSLRTLPPPSKSKSLDSIRSPPPTYSATTLNASSPNLAPISTNFVPYPSSSSPVHSPSPRVESCAAREAILNADHSTPLPSRLMKVVETYLPTLQDELPVKVGDTVRLIEEYRDEWSLVQRIGGPDAQKGVVPRFCLQERPTRSRGPSHKTSIGSMCSIYQA